jgi:transcriptional regulator with XRE-family HTH domain
MPSCESQRRSDARQEITRKPSARQSYPLCPDVSSMDRSYYGAIERGEFNLSVDTLLKIAAALEMTACELFGQAKL